METFLDFLRDSRVISLELLILVWLGHQWILERRRIRAQILENEAGAKCAHGKFKWHSCRSCAEEFCRQDLQDNADQVDDVDDQDEDLEDEDRAIVYSEELAPPSSNVRSVLLKAGGQTIADLTTPVLSALGSYFGGPVAGAAIAAAAAAARIPARPGWLIVDLPGDAGQVDLEISTDANWPGACMEFAVQLERGLISYAGNVPASICTWRECLTSRFGRGIRKIFIPDREGITRVKVIFNGCTLVDVVPSVLRALQSQ